MSKGIYIRTEEAKKHMSEAHMGYKHSKETRRKMSELAKGKRCSEETRRKLSKALTGRKISDEHRIRSTKNHKGMSGKCHSEETKQKMRETHLGKPSCWKGLKRPEMSERMRGSKNPFFGKTFTPEIKERIRESLRGKVLSEDTRNKISKALKGRKKQCYERRKPMCEETKRKISQSLKGHVVTEETLKKIMTSSNAKPNKQELKLFDYIETLFPNQYRLNVRGDILILGGKIPDIVNINGRKKLIELYGDYWHKGDDPQKRIDYFRQLGWDTLVIWGREINGKDLLKAKLLKFHTSFGRRLKGEFYVDKLRQ